MYHNRPDEKTPPIMPSGKGVSAAEKYFLRSPFRSGQFLLSTVVVALVAAWGTYLMVKIDLYYPPLSSLIFTLAFCPVGLWVHSLFTHWEIHSLLEESGRLPVYSRLHLFHANIVSSAGFLMFWAITMLLDCVRQWHILNH
ncbi:MAG: hypothetical protein ACLP1Y_16595 [Candidatus Acidiferrales bacterium]